MWRFCGVVHVITFFFSHQFTFHRARSELEGNFPNYDAMIRREIETSTKSLDDPEHLQSNIQQLHAEIEKLAEEARTKEFEWNKILYLKKMKEDILMRLTRQKMVLDIMNNKSIDDPDSLCAITDDPANNIDPKSSGGASLSPAMSFILSRSSMKSADLAKEKSSINSLSRSIHATRFCFTFIVSFYGFICKRNWNCIRQFGEFVQESRRTSRRINVFFRMQRKYLSKIMVEVVHSMCRPFQIASKVCLWNNSM